MIETRPSLFAFCLRRLFWLRGFSIHWLNLRWNRLTLHSFCLGLLGGLVGRRATNINACAHKAEDDEHHEQAREPQGASNEAGALLDNNVLRSRRGSLWLQAWRSEASQAVHCTISACAMQGYTAAFGAVTRCVCDCSHSPMLSGFGGGCKRDLQQVRNPDRIK